MEIRKHSIRYYNIPCARCVSTVVCAMHEPNSVNVGEINRSSL